MEVLFPPGSRTSAKVHLSTYKWPAGGGGSRDCFLKTLHEEVKKKRANQRADSGSHDIVAKEKDAPVINLYKRFIIYKFEAQNL